MAVVDSTAPVRAERPESDFRVEWFRGSGAGGQHRNKHANSARVIHVPTGIRRECQGRKRESNLRDAMAALVEELDRLELGEARGREAVLRREQVGSGMRGDKRRTYRFQEDRVRDHVTGRSSTTARVMRGDFSELWG